MNTKDASVTWRTNTAGQLFIFTWFAFLFFGIAYLYGGGQHFRHSTPWYVLISRDVVWLLFVLSVLCRTPADVRRSLWKSDYGTYLKVFAALIVVYVLIVLSHLVHRDVLGLLQHDLRNILLYALILPVLPLAIKSPEHIIKLRSQLLWIGVVLSLFGILSRFLWQDVTSWSGRITAMMGDPNNFAVFLSFCIIALLSAWDDLGLRRAIPILIIYALAMVLANSLSALAVLLAGISLFVAFRAGILKAFAILLASIYMLVVFSFSVKKIEHPTTPWKDLAMATYNVDRHMVDRLDNVTRGAFSKTVLFGMEFPTPPAMRSLTHRLQQAAALQYRMRSEEIFFGHYGPGSYVLYENQYLNFISNAGVVSATLFIAVFSAGIWQAYWVYCANRQHALNAFNLSIAAFLSGMLVFGFNGMAYLNRFPLNYLFYLLLGTVFVSKGFTARVHED